MGISIFSVVQPINKSDLVRVPKDQVEAYIAHHRHRLAETLARDVLSDAAVLTVSDGDDPNQTFYRWTVGIETDLDQVTALIKMREDAFEAGKLAAAAIIRKHASDYAPPVTTYAGFVLCILNEAAELIEKDAAHV